MWTKRGISKGCILIFCILIFLLLLAWYIQIRIMYALSSVVLSLIVISYYNFPLREALIFIIAPITPFISLLIEELYDNNKCIDVAEDIKKDSCHDWQNVYDNKFNEAEINDSFEKLMMVVLFCRICFFQFQKHFK